MIALSKLRLRPEVSVLVTGDDAAEALLGVEEGFALQRDLPGEPGSVQQAVLFARNAAQLEEAFRSVALLLTEEAVLWIAYPKKSGAIRSDLSRDAGWELVTAAGYEGVAQLAVDADWSILRFKKREQLKAFKRGTPMHERKIEGVDFQTRTVTLPADAAEAVGSVPGASDFFKGLSFSHQREWAEAIAAARRPETRARRIAKMVEDLRAKVSTKSAR